VQGGGGARHVAGEEICDEARRWWVTLPEGACACCALGSLADGARVRAPEPACPNPRVRTRVSVP